MRLWPDSLAGRTLALLLGMTLLLIVGGALLLHDERRERFDERNRFQLAERVAMLARLLADAEDDERERILARVSGAGDEISLDAQPLVERVPSRPLEERIARKLARSLGLTDRGAVRVRVEFRAGYGDVNGEGQDRRRHAWVHDLAAIVVSVRLWDGSWLNVLTDRFDGPPPLAGKTLQLLALLLTVLVIGSLLVARRMARPMAQLAEAAEGFGLGRTRQHLAEEGPREVRRTIRAFNEMQERLHRHITERSQMLAAVSHDLRTPVTTLRLRAEYVQDPEVREKILATLAEMESILSATLAFARDEAADEASRAIDLAALMQTLVDDRVDLGEDTAYDGPDRLSIHCRPVALRRALNNLLDNALRYGKAARVRLSRREGSVEVRIDDDGPGLAPDQLEAVFAPFYRVEGSRSRDTGGTGLGLAVARAIVLAHGGTLHLENRDGGGLRAVVCLPQRGQLEY